MMNSSEQTNEIAEALSKAQSELNPAAKDSINPHFRSKYADLAACWETAKPVLGKYGLAVIQGIETNLEKETVGVPTRLTHKSGQWFEFTPHCKPRDLSPQSVGSAVTYLRRYGFSAIIGLVSEEDDDGHQAQPKRDDDSHKNQNAGIFEGKPDQKKIINEILKKSHVPEDDYELIYKKMMGKPRAYIATILGEYKQ